MRAGTARLKNTMHSQPAAKNRALGAVRQASPFDASVSLALNSTCGSSAPITDYASSMTANQVGETIAIGHFPSRVADAVAIWLSDQHETILAAHIPNGRLTSANLSWAILRFRPDFMRTNVLYSDCVQWSMPSSVSTWRGKVREFVTDYSEWNGGDTPEDVRAEWDRFLPALTVEHSSKSLTFTAATRSSAAAPSSGVVHFVYVESSVLARTPETLILYMQSEGLEDATSTSRRFASPRLTFSPRAIVVRACSAVVNVFQCSEVDLSDAFVVEAERRYGVVAVPFNASASAASASASTSTTTSSSSDVASSERSHLEVEMTSSSLRLRTMCAHNATSADAGAGNATAEAEGSAKAEDGTGQVDSASEPPLPPLLYVRSAEAGVNSSVLALNPLDLSLALWRIPSNLLLAYVRCSETEPIEQYSLNLALLARGGGGDYGGSAQWQAGDRGGSSLGALACTVYGLSGPGCSSSSDHHAGDGDPMPRGLTVLGASLGALAVFMLFMVAARALIARKLLGTRPGATPAPTGTATTDGRRDDDATEAADDARGEIELVVLQ